MKKLLITSSFLILSSTVGATSVGGSIGGWNVVSQVANGIGQKLTATKDVMINGASKVVTGTANLTPNPNNVARFMGKVGVAAVVTEAMNQILDGVDYVMDPANNTLQYKEKPAPVADIECTSSNPCYSSQRYFYILNGWKTSTGIDRRFSSAQAACSALYSDYQFSIVGYSTGSKYCHMKFAGGGNDNVLYYSAVNPHYDPSKVDQQETKAVPLSDVASQVITQAEEDIRAGNPASPAVVLSRAVAQDMAAEAETDDVKARPISNQFEQTQSIPTDEDATGTIDTPEVVDPVTGEVVKPGESASISMKWPKACDWFPQACQFIEWAMTDPNVDDEEVPEKELEKQEIDEDLIKINNRSCPADVKFDVTGLPFGIQINKGYNMQEICNKVEPLKYVFEAVTLVLCGFMLLRV